MSAVIVGVVVGVVGLAMAYDSGKEQKKASQRQVKAQKESSQAQGRMSEIEAQRARIAQMREARIRQASVLASTGGVSESSGTAGAVSSIGSQMASNIGNIGVNQQLAGQASAANQRSADAAGDMFTAQAKGQQWQAIGNFGTTIFSANYKAPVANAKTGSTK